jgi:hypothetical protein
MTRSDVAPPTRPKEQFGQVAMRKGYVSERQVHDALARQRELTQGGSPHKLIGMIMLEMGALGTTELIDVLRELNIPYSPKTERRSLN